MRAWIGLGANLGDAAATIARAIDAIDALPSTRVVRVSSLYRSAPVDAQGPDFVNAVAEIETTLSPPALLAQLRAIETGEGRRRPYRNAPRTLDLDLLLASDADAPLRIDSPSLVLPHPRMHLRAFVLAPLAELDPRLTVPGHGHVADLLAACTGQRIERIGATPRHLPAAAPR
ncbi:MAG: 2-amino-4-hydroxy-6-hydroxymethyldihydropteridine diphosphokinase [Burkholderiaceae bacterium]|nr:2-amino-4-hydroxy-6-hydroxymethyldihydropteridine diphosphokinase [Burkholderiaceae bacterium]MEB2349986.1 2-amino-4-hydroxy-6-hydroxymethyldihydropteridine diphosphokinase [Burkholderiaceae bacterium]